MGIISLRYKSPLLCYIFVAFRSTYALESGTSGLRGLTQEHENDELVSHTLKVPSIFNERGVEKKVIPDLQEDNVDAKWLNMTGVDLEDDRMKTTKAIMREEFDGFPTESSIKHLSGQEKPDAAKGEEGEGGRSSRTICGDDDRIQVEATTSYPWRAVTQLGVTWPNGDKGLCSGSLIGKRAVVTAGHCLYSHEQGGHATSVLVSPGRNGDVYPFGSQYGSTIIAKRGWTENKDYDYDYGAIILPDTYLSDQVGYFGFRQENDDSLQSTTINRSGYPGGPTNGRRQFFTSGTIDQVSSRRFFYFLDSRGGASGGPVWVLENDNRYVVGIHNSGYEGGCTVGPNGAVRVQSSVYDFMQRMRNDYT